MLYSMATARQINLSGGDAAFPFEVLGESAFQASLKDLHRYYISDLSYSAVPTPINTLTKIVPYLVRRGFLPVAHLFPQRLKHRLLLLGSGTTEGFEHVVRLLMLDIQREKRCNNHFVDPVIMMPVPTYGYFLKQAELWGLPYVAIPRRMNEGGTLLPQDVRAAFERLDKQGKRVVAFYDCNPHNPLGLIRHREETEALAEVFREINEIYHQRNIEHARVTVDNPNGEPWNGPASRLRIIDDLVYDGLEFSGQEPAFSFAQIEEMRSDVILLLGLSKLGLAGLRAGLMIADQQFIRRSYDLQVAGSYFPNQPAIRAIEQYFRDEQPFQTWRTNHLQALTETHEFRGKLMKALIDGLDTVANLSTTDKSAMVLIVAKYHNIDHQAAAARLLRSIENVRVLSRPKAGFFHMLDFSALKGTYFRDEFGTQVGPIEDEGMLERILSSEGFYMCFGVWTGLSKDCMLERVSFAVDTDVIIEAIDRLEELVARFNSRPR